MSTKCTLVSGKNFQLFEEALDPASHVWLDLKGCAFEATKLGLRVEIPLTIWEVIRQHTTAHYDLAALSDAQLRAEAEKRVESARSHYREALTRQRTAQETGKMPKRRKNLLRLLHPDAHRPRGQHLAALLAALRKERAAQRRLQRAVERFRRQQTPPSSV